MVAALASPDFFSEIRTGQATKGLSASMPGPSPPADAPRFHTHAELLLELPPPLLDWVRRGAVRPPPSAPINHSAEARGYPDITSVAFYDNYNLPSAIRVTLDNARTVVLRRGSRSGSVELEAAAFTLLASVGLPVPVILAGPSSEIEGEADFCMVVTELAGMNLLKISMLPPASGGLGHGQYTHGPNCSTGFSGHI